MEHSLAAANRKIEQLERELNEVKANQLKDQIIAALSSPKYRIISPREFYKLFCQGQNARLENGQIRVDYDGLPRTLDQLVDRVQFDPESAHLFRAKGDTKPSETPTNPFAKQTWNLTRQGELTRQNPALAARLRAEAASYSCRQDS